LRSSGKVVKWLIQVWLIRVVNGMLLCFQKSRFYIILLLPSVPFQIFGLATLYSLFSSFFLGRVKDSIEMFPYGKKSSWLGLKGVAYVSIMKSGKS